MPFTGIFWYLIDKYNDDGKFEAPYYFKGKKHNYVYKDNKVYAIEGMPVIGNKILKDGRWKEIPHNVAKRLERKVIEEIPSESLPIVLYDEVFSWINFYQS